MIDIGTVKILPIDRPNWNGRIYNQSVVQSVIEKCKTPVFGSLESVANIDLTKVSHITENLRVENGWLVGDVKVLKTPMGQILSEILLVESNINFTFGGYGNISADGVISNLVIWSVNAYIGEEKYD
jgi:hypothetical protein